MRLALSFTLLFALSATQAFAQEVRPFYFGPGPGEECAPFFDGKNIGDTTLQDMIARSLRSKTRSGESQPTSRMTPLTAAEVQATVHQALEGCASLLAGEVKKQVDWEPTNTGNDEARSKEVAKRNRDLIELHLSAKSLKRWTNKAEGESLVARNADRVAAKLEDDLHKELAKADLRQQIWAALVAGVAHPRQANNPDNPDSPDSLNSPDATSVALPTSALEFQSMHWLSDRRFHFGLGARLGLQPVTVMKQKVPPTEAGSAPASTTEATPFSVQQTALLMSARLGLNWAASTSQEVTLYYEPGLSALIKPETVSTTEDRRVDAFVVPVDNGQDRLSESKEFGIEWNLFKDELVNVHEFKTFTTPQVRIGIGLRTDRRFTAAGALAAFKNPERRTMYRISVDDIPVFDRRAGDLKPAAFKVGISLEYERAGWITRPKGATVPAGMRLVMQGNLGLLQILGK